MRNCRISSADAEKRVALRVSIAKQKQERGPENSSSEKPGGIFDKVGEHHQRDAEEHRSPDVQAFSVNEGDKTDGSKDQSTNEVGEGEGRQHGLRQSLTQANACPLITACSN